MAGAPATVVRTTFMKVSWEMPGECRSRTCGRRRPLQGQQRTVETRRQRRHALQLLRNIGEVRFLGAGIDHQIKVGLARQAREHEIVLDGALLGQQQAVALHAFLQARDIGEA